MFKTLVGRTAVVVPVFALSICLSSAGLIQAQTDKSADTLFRQIDTNGDGVVKMEEATFGTKAFLAKIFEAAGKQPTDSLTREEFQAAYDRHKNKSPTTPTSRPMAETKPAAELEGSSSGPMQFADANGDGKISRAEWSKLTQTFSQLDADKNNALEVGELEATGGLAEPLSQLGDADHDQKISRVEWGKLVASFARLDANHDNAIDEYELKKAAEAAVASASGSAGLPGSDKPSSGPILWRGTIEGRGGIELLVQGNHIIGRDVPGGGGNGPGPGGRPGMGGPGMGGPGGRGPGGGGGGGSGNGLGGGTFTMTGDGKTGNMDAVYTEGDRRGDVCLGIYRLEGDKLIWCVNNKGGRPQSLTGGNGNWLLTLTRVDNDDTALKK